MVLIISILYKISSKLSFFINNIRYSYYRNKYTIHRSFRFNGNSIFFYGEGDLKIDEESYIGSLSTIQISSNNKVSIGKRCSISHNVRLYTSSLVPDGDFSCPEKVEVKYGDVIIEDYVWIGANVFINPGVRIGTNSVIGANSVVTKDIEPNSIYGGVPAKLIRLKKNV